MLIWIIPFVLISNAGAAIRQNTIQQIRLQDTPQRISLQLNQRSLFKIIQVDKTEIVIALKDVHISDSIEKRGSASSFIQNLRIEHLQNNVTLLIIETVAAISKTDTKWDGSSTLVVNFYAEKQKHKTRRKGLKTKSKRKPIRIQEQAEQNRDKNITEEVIPAKEEIHLDPPSDFAGGSIDDLLEEFATDPCASKPELKRVLAQFKNKNWKEAEPELTRFLKTNTGETCRASAFFLKAYSFYKQVDFDKEDNILESISVCQDAVNLFSDSRYLPYGMTMIGKLYFALNNQAEAKGYFKIVLDKYPKYRGSPEIIFELGVLEEKKNNHRNAIENFEKIISQYPKSIFISDARLELGKAHFKINNFSKAIEQLELLINENPRKIYNSSDALLFMGNSYYHTGKYKEARTILEKAYNLYPEIDSSHIVLTRIADTLADEEKIERAKMLYQLVIEKYPGTDGFVISSVRLAKYFETREEKEKVYRLIIEDYPDNPMANLARLRIAEIQNNAGEYKQSIETINELFLENPRALNKEALFIKQNSFESYFKWIMEKGNYPEVLAMYERDKQSLDTYENPGLFSLIGESYFRGHLYESAARLLLEADNYTKDARKPDKYTYMIGVSLQESGENDKASSYLLRYIKANPKSEYTADAFRRMARIEKQNNKDRKASEYFQTAFNSSRRETEKADILIEHAGLFNKNHQYHESAALLVKAVNILSSSPESDKAMILNAHRELGKSYMYLHDFLKAADAFAMALKFSEIDEDRIGLHFLLGESYSKEGHLNEASQAYQAVVSSGDAFWSKLAAEKLKGLKLTKKINKT